MTGQVALNKNLSALRPLALWVTAGFGALVLVYLIAARIEATVTRWPPTIREGVAASHCTQFIALAKAAYGDDWKVRLDPRDTTCAQEIRDEWERHFLPRTAPNYEPAYTVAPLPPAVAPVQTYVPAPATRCLNVISLAKARYGAAWQTKLSPEEARDCLGSTVPTQ